MTTPNEVPELIAAVLIAVPSVAILGRLFWVVGEEIWNCHGWKLFKHPTLKPGARVIILKPAWRSWNRYEACVGTIEKQCYQSTFQVLIDGEPESCRFYTEELELVPPSAKAYEELFL